jgi:hypothetical protein
MQLSDIIVRHVGLLLCALGASGSNLILIDVFRGYPQSHQVSDMSVESNRELLADVRECFSV